MPIRSIAAPIAERQLGLVARRQLIACGVPEATVDAAVRRGALLRVRRGVYRLPGIPETPELRLRARALAAGDDAVFSHRSAAWLWQLLTEAPVRHDLTVPYPVHPRHIDATVHRSADLHLAIPGHVRGLPVTGVGRTILDCAADPTIDLELLIDAARRNHDISRTLLPQPSLPTLARDARGSSGYESSSSTSRSRSPTSNAWWHGGSEPRGSPDGSCTTASWSRCTVRWRSTSPWPDIKVALELEGTDHRDRQGVHDNDTARQNWITVAGYRVVRTTYRRWLRNTVQVRHELEAALAV